MAAFTAARLAARGHVAQFGLTARRPLRRGRVGPPTAAADDESPQNAVPILISMQLAKIFEGQQYIFDTNSNMREYSWSKDEKKPDDSLQLVMDLAESMAGA